MPVDPMCNHFGVGLRRELVATTLELFPQLVVILDDAVVNDCEPVMRDMWMRVALARNAVGGPARVCDSDLAGNGCLLQGLLQHSHFADSPQPLEVLSSV